MVVKGVTLEDLAKAMARASGAYDGNLEFAYSPVALNQRGDRWRFRVKARSGAKNRRTGERPPGCMVRYCPFRGVERGAAAACWHAFRDFMRALLELKPEAVIKSAAATYRGSEGFEENYRETGWRNIGSQMYPLHHADACECGEGAR